MESESNLQSVTVSSLNNWWMMDEGSWHEAVSLYLCCCHLNFQGRIETKFLHNLRVILFMKKCKKSKHWIFFEFHAFWWKITVTACLYFILNKASFISYWIMDTHFRFERECKQCPRRRQTLKCSRNQEVSFDVWNYYLQLLPLPLWQTSPPR